MFKIAAVYTAITLVELLTYIFQENFPEAQLVNIIDDSLIAEVIRNNGPTKSVKRKLFIYYEAGFESGADVVLNTCSSVGEIVDFLQPLLISPFLRLISQWLKKRLKQLIE